jgi:hypothetical protein
MRELVQHSRRVARAPKRPGLSKRWSDRAGALLVGLTVLFTSVNAQALDPTVLDPNLGVRTAVGALNQPTGMAFLPHSDPLMLDILVLEKSTGKMQRVVNGSIQSTVLDLAVNSASELLGRHPSESRRPRACPDSTRRSPHDNSPGAAGLCQLGEALGIARRGRPTAFPWIERRFAEHHFDCWQTPPV